MTILVSDFESFLSDMIRSKIKEEISWLMYEKRKAEHFIKDGEGTPYYPIDFVSHLIPEDKEDEDIPDYILYPESRIFINKLLIYYYSNKLEHLNKQAEKNHLDTFKWYVCVCDKTYNDSRGLSGNQRINDYKLMKSSKRDTKEITKGYIDNYFARFVDPFTFCFSKGDQAVLDEISKGY
jgi:hypothetical protein